MAAIEIRPRVFASDIPNSPFIRSRYDQHDSVSFKVETPSMTRQEFKDECDVNIIVARHAETGLWDKNLKPPTRCPQFIDIANAPDAMTAHNLFIQAREAFMSLPANVRRDMDNNPNELIAFVSDDNNYDKALEYGLVNKRPDPLPTPTPTPTPMPITKE